MFFNLFKNKNQRLRLNSVVRFDKSQLSEHDYSTHFMQDFPEDSVFIFLGDMPQIPNFWTLYDMPQIPRFCILYDIQKNKIIPMCYKLYFIEIDIYKWITSKTIKS